MSEKRHRLYDSEIPEVILGLHLRLKQLLEKKEDAEKAETALRCMHRLLAKNLVDQSTRNSAGNT